MVEGTSSVCRKALHQYGGRHLISMEEGTLLVCRKAGKSSGRQQQGLILLTSYYWLVCDLQTLFCYALNVRKYLKTFCGRLSWFCSQGSFTFIVQTVSTVCQLQLLPLLKGRKRRAASSSSQLNLCLYLFSFTKKFHEHHLRTFAPKSSHVQIFLKL